MTGLSVLIVDDDDGIRYLMESATSAVTNRILNKPFMLRL